MFQLFIFIFIDLYAFNTAQLVDITINKISRTLNGEIQTTVSFAEITESYELIDHFHISVVFDDGSTQDQGKSLGKEATSAVFQRDIVDLAKKEVRFIITGQTADDVDTHWGQVKLQLPEFLGEDGSIGSWVGKNGDISLRIDPMESIFGYELEDITCEGDATKSCYFVGATKKVASPIQLCQKVNLIDVKAEKIIICDETLTIDNEHIGGASPVSAELIYPKSGSGANIIIEPADQEIVVYKDSEVVKVCYTSTCDIGKHVPSTETNKVLMVGLTAKVPSNSEVIEITDYELFGTGLSVDLIETRWTRTADVDSYKVSRSHNENDDGSSFEETMVTCKDEENSDNFHCFAYFVGLEENSAYELTVEKGLDDEMNMVTLKGTSTSAAGGGGKSLKISSVDTKWHKGLRGIEVNICFQNEDASHLSSYEAILLNKIGQWRKFKGVTHKIGNELCFDALHLDIHSFDLSESLKLVVVERGQDGITVLESAETVISVEGNLSFTDK